MATQTRPPIEVPVVPPAQMPAAGGELVHVPSSPLAMARAPEIVLAEAQKAAQAIRQVIEQRKNKVVINGKTFLQFEDWQTLGRFYGVSAIARSTNPVNFGRAQGFECHSEALLISSDQVISAADGMCLDDEERWADKPLFQLRSMAQTRACAKSLRNVLAWVVVLAGYSPTPAEEVDGEGSTPATPEARETRTQFQTWLNAIAQAKTLDELRTVFEPAYKAAQAAGATTILEALVRAKDIRKGALCPRR